MTRSEKILCTIYAIIAVVALFATWVNNIAFMRDPENWQLASWYNALYANYAAASFINDLFALGIAVCVFMVVEGMRLKIRFFWLYILLSGLTAISFTFPLFMIARQFKIAQNRAIE
jgi:Terpene cyclase DEP1